MTVRVIGTITSLRVQDVSKRAGVENLKSYLEVDVEPGGALEGVVQFIHDGALDLAVGARVEIETYATANGPQPIYKIAVHRRTDARS